MDELLEVGKTLEVIRADSTLQFNPRDPDKWFPWFQKEINIINASINSLDSILISGIISYSFQSKHIPRSRIEAI